MPNKYCAPSKFSSESNKKKKLIKRGREQDGGGADGCEIHLSPRIYQEYIFRHRSARKTPAESGQEYLTSGKEYIDPHKTQDRALSHWSGSTEFKTLDYQRTNPRGYQIVRTHTMETTVIQDPASPNHR